MTLEETRRQQAIEDTLRERRRRDLSAHERAAVEQRQRIESLESELAAIAAAPSESARELHYRILDLRREIQTMSEGRGVQFEFRRRLAILQAYERKLAAIEERRPGTLMNYSERYAEASVDPEHESAYQRLLQARMERAIQGRTIAETFVPSVTVTPSPRQAEAEMMYYSGNAFPASGMVAPMPISPPSQELTAWFQRLQEGWVQVGAAPTPTPAPVAPPPNPLHSITPLPRKIVMDRS